MNGGKQKSPQPYTKNKRQLKADVTCLTDTTISS